jgi:glutathione S-transferase
MDCRVKPGNDERRGQSTSKLMILIGQFDSPFVRRVGIALRLYDLPFEHRPWSTFGDADKIAPYNPLRRVPTLVLDDGEVLIESTAILALATGLGDKAVSLVYERLLHRENRTSGRSDAKPRSPACLTCWRPTAPAANPRTGSATRSVTPTSQ